jgi:hypothetical protein
MFKKAIEAFGCGFVIVPMTILGILKGGFKGGSGAAAAFGNFAANFIGIVSLILVSGAIITTVWFTGPIGILIGFLGVCTLSGIIFMVGEVVNNRNQKKRKK